MSANAHTIALYRSRLISTNSIANGTFPADTWIDLPVTNQYDPNTFTLIGAVQPPRRARRQFVSSVARSCSRAMPPIPAAPPSSTISTLNLTSGSPFGNWNVVWSDEFNGAIVSIPTPGPLTSAAAAGATTNSNITPTATTTPSRPAACFISWPGRNPTTAPASPPPV